MTMKRFLVALFVVLGSGCATSYHKTGFTGGFSEVQIKDDVWRIGFSGNGFTDYETVQTYWLFHCAEFTIDKGYAGFEIQSKIKLTMDISPEDLLVPGEPRAEKTRGGGGVIFVPGSGASGPKPAIVAVIQLLKGPLVADPPRRFNAQMLKDALLPIVDGKKCSGGNVCPHSHRYLYNETSAPSA